MAKKILIVDDDVSTIKVLTLRLQSAGFSVVAAYGGKEALEKVVSEKPDLICLDITMPPPNGLQVCQILKEKESAPPIIILTAKTSDSDKFWASDVGADAYLTKPYDGEELIKTIESLLK